MRRPAWPSSPTSLTCTPTSECGVTDPKLCQAALSAARAVDTTRPVIASLSEENVASRATAERAGLSLQWRGSDQTGVGAARLVFADRTLDAGVLGALIGRG